MSTINQAAGGCGCPTGGCAVTITGTVFGCGGLVAPGVAVTVHDSTSGGTVLGTATTDGGGNYSIAATGATAGNNIVVVPTLGARFNSTSSTLAFTAGAADSTHWKCGATSSGVGFALTAAVGYHCLTGCPIPLADTLNFTHTFFGSGTLTWAAPDIWTGTVTYTYPGCSLPYPPFTVCTPQPVDISIVFTGGVPHAGYQLTTFGCPYTGTIGSFYDETITSSSLTCYPLNAVSNYAAGRGADTMYCTGAPSADTLTITE